MLNTELFVLPSTYGRSAAGVSATSNIHTLDAASVTSPAAPRWPSRRRTGPGAAARYAIANAGSTAHACAIFRWNATPTHTPDSSRVRSRPVRTARCHASAANTSASTSSASA
jgi:hypothetical protein